MNNIKKIQKSLIDNPDILDKVMDGLDSFASLKKERIPHFDEVYGDLIKEHLRSSHTSEEPTRKQTPLFLKKAFYVPVSICLMLGVFFFTPIGKAAENIYRTVVQWFDSGVKIHYGKGEVIEDTEQLNSVYYESIQDVREATKEKIAWNKDNSIIGNIVLIRNGAELQIVTKYSTQQNIEIMVTQSIVTKGETEWNTTINSEGGTPIDIIMPDGSQYIGFAKDNYCCAVNFQNNTCIEVLSDNSDYDSFINFIKGIQVE